MTNQPSARHRWLESLWDQLRSRFGNVSIGQEALDRAILECTNAYEGDFAMAAALRSTLVNAKAATARVGDRPHSLVYELVDTFPEWVDNGPGSAAYNAHLQREHERNLAEFERDRQREYENSPQSIERRMMERFVNEQVEKRLVPLRAELDALREQVAQLQIADLTHVAA